MFEENGRPLADLKQLIGALEPAITEKALAVAETWISTGVMDDTLSEPLNATDPDRAAHMIATEATLDALGVEDLPYDLSPKITPLVEKRMAVLNAYHDRLDGIAEKVMQRVRDGAGLGSDAAVKALVDDVVLAGGGALSGNEFAVVEQMVARKLTDMVAAS
jgi:hypothetical protein